ncbi:6927_t:CDS:1, partial [Racocetra fulgida]
MPFIPNTLLEILGKDKTKYKNNLFQKLEEIEVKIHTLTDNENKIIQKLEDNEKIIQELKKIKE